MTIHEPSGPPRPHESKLVTDPQRGPLAPFGIPGGQS